MKFNKISIFGDSILRGAMYSEEKNGYVLRNGHKFDLIRSRGIEVKNNSRIGATIEKGIEILNRSIEELDSKSIVIFEYGGNDCDFNWENISAAPEGDHSPNTSPSLFISLYKDIIKSIRKTGANAALTSLVPLDSEKYMNWITRNRSYNNILKWLGDKSILYRWQEYYSNLCKDLAKELECDFIDIRSDFLLSHKYSELLCADGIHPTDAGHILIENNICSYIDKIA